jgi:hypothetical protein
VKVFAGQFQLLLQKAKGKYAEAHLPTGSCMHIPWLSASILPRSYQAAAGPPGTPRPPHRTQVLLAVHSGSPQPMPAASYATQSSCGSIRRAAYNWATWPVLGKMLPAAICTADHKHPANRMLHRAIRQSRGAQSTSGYARGPGYLETVENGGENVASGLERSCLRRKS